ncbi:zona pellucida sperm-binding protein 3-like isoform X2 [Sinocyclocheilus anshuiensis]|uniref:zona pellucida sperm-binding protein 3-like isoform X2 n=1 Tax=Sinocyclocheilus anshuiensis TaxID=1608454 RepID=UPI0007B86E22|nr:PREDICTED: zona pellucida sperm-binding protein 3-like isoform X2 [Sinocyclocheilus anshuiensis]
MGFWQVGFGLVCLLALGFPETLWRAKRSSNWTSNNFMPRVLSRVQQTDSRMSPIPQKYDPSNLVFAPQRFPAPFPVQTPARSEFGKPSQDLLGVQSKELLLGPVQKLTWCFPSLPEEPQQPDVPFDLRYPVPANSVAARCAENSVYVEVMQDFFGNGKPLRSSAFTLGGCTAAGEDPSAQVLIFESELHGCGSTLKVTEDELVYTFKLVYTPQEVSYGVPIVRSSSAVVGIECHFSRKHNVSSDALMPTWIPYATSEVAEEIFVFSLRLMTDDWRFERPSNQYFLGDIINFEASVQSYSHVPICVFVDRCVATTVPDVASVPRYSFIENDGCLVDAKLTGSRSRFMPQTRGDKLQFQLEAFRFHQADNGLVYITCILKVAAATTPTPISPEPKACSFSANGWVSADDSHQVCGCCDTTCSTRSGSDQILKDLRWDRASVGPIKAKEYGQK